MKAKKPLVIVHGICNNKNLFYYPKGNCLSTYLSEYFELYPFEYPFPENRYKNWNFDYHLEKEFPVFWKKICNQLGEKPLVMGYSMGGMLTMAAQATGKIDAPGVAAVASPFLYSGIPFYPTFMGIYTKIADFLNYRRVPIKLIGRLLCFCFSLMTRNPSRQHQLKLFRLFVRKASVDVPIETIHQALIWAISGQLLSRDSKINYREEMIKITSKSCFIAGDKDIIATPEAVKEGYLAVNSSQKVYRILPGGDHMTLAAGKNARQVAKIIKEWSEL